jgi:putative transposase
LKNTSVKKRHQPIHIYIENQLYFLTVHTYQNQHLLQDESRKQHLLNKIRTFFEAYDFVLYTWVILDNHYHLLFKSSDKINLGKLVGKIHAGYSYESNRQENHPGRKIWQNYWDWCIRSEKDFWTHFNYIHHNPVKHGYVQQMELYPFSSYSHWLAKKGEDWMCSVLETHPVIDFTADHEIGTDPAGVNPSGFYKRLMP